MSTNRPKGDLMFKCLNEVEVEDKYRQYSAEDFAWDDKFIQWVTNGVGEKEWKHFLLENPHQSTNIETAREIIKALQTGRQESVEDEEMLAIWKEIESLHSLVYQEQTGRPKRLRERMQYMAVLALVFCVGVAVPLVWFVHRDDQFAGIRLSPLDVNETKLVLPGGAEVLSKEKKTDIRFDAAGGQVKINQDSVIHYQNEAATQELTQVIVPFGKISNVLLPDGTKISLNAGSQLLFPQAFTGNERKVFLTGEAYFEVAKNKDKPFVVCTNSINVKVTGTTFNLRDHASDNETEVVLVEGEVSLKENKVFGFLGKETKLRPNQRAVYDKQDKEVVVETNVDAGYYTSWRKGLLEFKRESILHVFERLARYYHVRFITEESVELNRKISGKLDLKESLEDVMRVVSDAAPVTYRIEEDKVYVNSKIPYLPIK